MNSVAYLDPGSVDFSTPGAGFRDGWKIRIRIRDEQPGSYFQEFKNHILWVNILEFFEADPGSGIQGGKIGFRDGKNTDPGPRINIPDPQHWRKKFLLLCRNLVAYRARCLTQAQSPGSASRVAPTSGTRPVKSVPMLAAFIRCVML